MRTLVSRFQKGLAKTKANFVDGINRTLSRSQKLDEATLEELEEVMLSSDVGFDTTEMLIEELRQQYRDSRVEAKNVLQIFHRQLVSVLTEIPAGSLPQTQDKPYVMSIVGVNGTGKTTTIGKLGHHLSRQGKSVVFAAADTFRAGAIDQLSIWAQRAGAEIIHSTPGADPAAVAFDAIKSARARNKDTLIIDTAGRLHTKQNLMEELKKIHRILGRENANAPHEVNLVIDATTGQNGLIQARQFADAVKVTGLILTKLDGTARGGIVFSIAHELQIPVRYVGIGEKPEDLLPFDADQFVEALLS